MPVAEKKYYQIASLEKGIKVLELLAEHKGLTVSQTAAHIDINRASAHRYLATLRDLGYVEQNDDNSYQLTIRIMEMATKVLDRFDIRHEARRFMQMLSKEFKETVNLGYWDGKDILHLDKIDSTEILRMDAPYWSMTPAYCTALGKAILAYLPEHELNEYLSTVRFTPYSPKTIVSKKKLREELKTITERGYAIDDEELAIGLRCLAAPVFDHSGNARYAMSVSAPTIRMTMERVELVQVSVREVCRQLSQKLGYRPSE